MKYILNGFILTIVVFGISAQYANAEQTQCSTQGVTVVYINGILTTKEQANGNKKKIKAKFYEWTNNKNIIFKNAYNASHLGGFGDLIKSAEQAYKGVNDKSISDFDLKTIINDIHTSVHTQKILLVGHSQGSFYTNEVYKYLIKNGIPKSAVAVYNVATPASFTAGKGNYTTSDTDSVIRAVREATILGRALTPLPANVSFKLNKKEKSAQWAGHDLSSIYLKYGDFRISTGMEKEIDEMRSQQVPKNVKEGCFNPPKEGIVYSTKKFSFAIIDPTVEYTGKGFTKAKQIAVYVESIPTRIAIGIFKNVYNHVYSATHESVLVKKQQVKKQPPKRSRTAIQISKSSKNILKSKISSKKKIPKRNTISKKEKLADITLRLNKVKKILALLKPKVILLVEKQEEICRKRSIRGPWDKVGWVGDKPGCDDLTPGVQKMFWAPIQGVGGGAVTILSGSITGNPQSGFFGSTQIDWTTSGAKNCTVSGGFDSWSGTSGSKTTGGTIIGNLTYTLSCDNGALIKTTTVTGDEPWLM